jgi:kumamolisin
MSGGAWEDCFTPAQLAETHSLITELVGHHVTVIVSSGDSAADVTCGAPWAPVAKRGVQYPASDPLVLAVGGTTLVANPTTGSYISETAGDSPPYGSSGGGGADTGGLPGGARLEPGHGLGDTDRVGAGAPAGTL